MKLSAEQRLYCSDECPIGKTKKEEILNSCNSGYDAALDMLWFVEKCAETCERCKNKG
jgi:hypothetical protein